LKNLGSIDIEKYRAACDAVIKNESHKVYAYTLNLLRQLKKDDYTLVAITGSQHDIAQPFADKYGFDYCYGEVYATLEGKFSGEVETIFNRKDEIVRRFMKEHPEHSLKESVGIGDSHWDAKMLSLVDKPIAFNPDEGLLKIAKEKGWPVVIERKNIAYRLEKHGTELVLADTIIH
jgi:phosphoserine phosphatase